MSHHTIQHETLSWHIQVCRKCPLWVAHPSLICLSLMPTLSDSQCLLQALRHRLKHDRSRCVQLKSVNQWLPIVASPRFYHGVTCCTPTLNGIRQSRFLLVSLDPENARSLAKFDPAARESRRVCRWPDFSSSTKRVEGLRCALFPASHPHSTLVVT